MQNFVFLHSGSKFSTGVYFGHTNAGLIMKDFVLFPFKLLSIKNLYIYYKIMKIIVCQLAVFDFRTYGPDNSIIVMSRYLPNG